MTDLEFGKQLSLCRIITLFQTVESAGEEIPIPGSDIGFHSPVLEIVPLIEIVLIYGKHIPEAAENTFLSGIELCCEPFLQLPVPAGIGEGHHHLVAVGAGPVRKAHEIVTGRGGFLTAFRVVQGSRADVQHVVDILILHPVDDFGEDLF